MRSCVRSALHACSCVPRRRSTPHDSTGYSRNVLRAQAPGCAPGRRPPPRLPPSSRWSLPGDLDTRASATGSPASALIKLDLPTLLWPIKANSGRRAPAVLGRWSSLLLLFTNAALTMRGGGGGAAACEGGAAERERSARRAAGHAHGHAPSGRAGASVIAICRRHAYMYIHMPLLSRMCTAAAGHRQGSGMVHAWASHAPAGRLVCPPPPSTARNPAKSRSTDDDDA